MAIPTVVNVVKISRLSSTALWRLPSRLALATALLSSAMAIGGCLYSERVHHIAINNGYLSFVAAVLMGFDGVLLLYDQNKAENLYFQTTFSENQLQRHLALFLEIIADNSNHTF